jgi:hypothetical protein
VVFGSSLCIASIRCTVCWLVFLLGSWTVNYQIITTLLFFKKESKALTTIVEGLSSNAVQI